jgi:LysM repeat protein
MKRFYFLLVFILTLPILAVTQTSELLVKNGDRGLYIEHKVMPKEGLFPLGRLYNVHPRHIANYNGLDFNKGLVIGQLIKIPLTDTNFNQVSNQGIPVYYKAGEKEGLTRISNVNNKVSLENLRSWNKLASDNVNFGTKLIVGYLVSKEMKAVAPPVVIEKKKEPAKEDKPAIAEEKKEEIKTPVTEIKEEIKTPEEKKADVKPAETKQAEKKQEIIPAAKMDTGEEGFFKWHFQQQAKQQPVSKDQAVTSGIFKTTSGWNDGKYYLLIDDVQPGIIVKITNPTNNKSVYAKVLGKMEGINLNKGLDIRISNAAASTLGVTETDKFIVKVNY